MGMLDRFVKNGYEFDNFIDINNIPSIDILKRAIPIDVTDISNKVNKHPLPFINQCSSNDINNIFSKICPPFNILWIECKCPDNAAKFYGKRNSCLILSNYEQDDLSWKCEIYFFIETDYCRYLLPTFLICRINKEGTIKNYSDDNKCFRLYSLSRNGLRSKDWDSDELDEYYIKIMTSSIIWSFYSLNFIHCQNVKIVERIPTKKLKGKKDKKYLIKYYTLEINNTKIISKENIPSHNSDIKKSLHLCRGHFATYSAESPLFGKIAGTFWRHMHLRGSSEIGTVVKDYKLVNSKETK